ncbi:MAG: hypothetical protein R3F41_12390 [Gammaproteobacteria bacterium]|nr:hypothetical protein [Pseudomonadales bacterium]MCP5348895.1 hypothetical protein [Pseudomonadales bacterium]
MNALPVNNIYQTACRLLIAGFSASLLLACSPADQPPVAGTGEPAAGFKFDTSLSVADLMSLVIDPAADSLWDNAGWVESSAGYEELYPTTDEGWDFVRAQAALVAETGNLLALPGRAEDNDAWMVYAEGMVEAGKLAMDAAQRHHNDDFFQAGAQLYNVCRACHQSYNPDIASRYVDDEPQASPQ